MKLRLPFLTARRGAGLLAALTIIALVTGCFGRFPLTRASYQFNRDLSDDKYIRSIAFWPLIFLHAGAALGDILIVNPMEFWSGERMVREARLQDGTQVQAVAVGNNAPLQLTFTRSGQVIAQNQVVSLGEGRYEVRNANQQYLGTIRVEPNGQVNVL